MKAIFCLIVLSFSSLVWADCTEGVNCDTPAPNTNPDIPDAGWYWAGESENGVSGWGVNIEIQRNSSSASGYFLFGAVYSFSEQGQPTWFSFSGNYNPNSDVFAWRQGTGIMGSLNTQLFQSTNGSCLNCEPNIPSEASPADFETLEIVWSDPLHLTLIIGDIEHQMNRFRFHNGVGDRDISFITKGWWQVYYQSKRSIRNMYNEPLTTFPALKGLARFVELDRSLFDQYDIDMYNPDHQYYISNEINYLNGSDYYIYGRRFVTYQPRQLLIDYDPGSHKLTLHYLDSQRPYEIDECNHVISGYLRPSESANSVFYAHQDSRCEFDDLYNSEDAKASFAFLSPLGSAGDALLNNGLFSYDEQ